jgi:hypothetical protein
MIGHTRGSRLKAERLIAAIGSRARSAAELEAVICGSRCTVQALLATLRATGGAHVSAWGRSATGKPIPLYRGGPGQDKPSPPAQTKADKNRLYSRRVAADPERLMVQRAKKNAARVRIRRDPMIEALFGRAA